MCALHTDKLHLPFISAVNLFRIVIRDIPSKRQQAALVGSLTNIERLGHGALYADFYKTTTLLGSYVKTHLYVI